MEEQSQDLSSKKSSPLRVARPTFKARGVAARSESARGCELLRQRSRSLSLGGGRKEGTFEVQVAIINFLCVHFTRTVNLSLKGIIYSSLRRLLNSREKDFARCQVCDTGDKAEKAASCKPSHRSKETFHQSQRETIYNFKPLSDLLFPKGYALNLWVLPAFFFPLRTSLSGILRSPAQLRPGFRVSYLQPCWEPAETSGSLTLPSNTKDKRERMKTTEAREGVVLGSGGGSERPRRRSINGSCMLQLNAKGILTLSVLCEPGELLSLSRPRRDFLSSGRCMIKPR